MTTMGKKEYIKVLQGQYYQANKTQKGQILDEACRNLGMHRKSVIRLLSIPVGRIRKPKPRRRPFTYSTKTLWIIEELWIASDYLCSPRLKEAIAVWMPHLKQRYSIDKQTEAQLLKISQATIDRRLKQKKVYLKHKLYGHTKPGHLLRYQIPIQTKSWNITTPGFIEIDLVAHCGRSASGEFIYTLTALDIATGWVERRALLGKGMRGVVEALESIRQNIPINIIAFDSDNGSEFLNNHLIRYCQEKQIKFTRSRPYQKDDQAHVEQKNFTHVRRIFGYSRFDKLEVKCAMNEIYQKELSLFQNGFQPSFKLKSKRFIGTRTQRTFLKPKTPKDRMLDSKTVTIEEKEHIHKLFEDLDPFVLKRTIKKKLSHIKKLQYQPKRAA